MVARLSDWTTSPAAPINAAARVKLEQMRVLMNQGPGGQTQEALTIASGAVTPTGYLVTVDTEGAAATDDLDTINVTNLPEGSLIRVRMADASRVVRFTTSANLLLRDGVAVTPRSTSHWIEFARVGSSWQETARNIGNELRTVRALTSNTTLTASDSGTTLTNTGAAGDLNHPLPAATVGAHYRFRVTAAFKIKVTANGTDTIRDDDGATVSGAGGNTEIAAVIGNLFDIECFEAGKWVVVAARGTLTTT